MKGWVIIIIIRESLSYNYCNLHLSCEPHKIIRPIIYVVYIKNASYNNYNLVFALFGCKIFELSVKKKGLKFGVLELRDVCDFGMG